MLFDPYRMVFINLVALGLLTIGVLFYRFIYPKRNLNLFTLLLLISLIPILSIFRTGSYESGDFNIHVIRGMQFSDILKEGNLMPTWAGNLNATYGYPLFAFNYTIPYYLISLLHQIGFSFINSLKILLASSFIFSGVFMYYFSKKLFKNNVVAFAVSIFYLFTPYHLISLHFKVTIGEILAYTLIPLLFYFICIFIENRRYAYLALAGLCLGATALSHIFIAVFLIPIIFTFFIIQNLTLVKSSMYLLLILAISLLVSMYQWIAPIIYYPYLFTTAYPSNPLQGLYFPNIQDLLYSPWRYGFLFQGPRGELSFLLGYINIFILGALAVRYLKNKIQYKKRVLLWFSLLILAIFLITPYSKFIWQYLPFLKDAGSHRLLIIVSFIISVLMGHFIIIYKKYILIISAIICLSILTTILNWGQRTMLPYVNDQTLNKYLSSGIVPGDTHFYANSRWVNPERPWFSVIPKSHLGIVEGKAKIITLFRSSTQHEYVVEAESEIKLRENTLYFPGWKAYSNEKEVKIYPNSDGVIQISLPQGKHKLNVIYNDLYFFSLSKVTSISSIIFFLSYAILSLCKERFKISKASSRA